MVVHILTDLYLDKIEAGRNLGPYLLEKQRELFAQVRARTSGEEIYKITVNYDEVEDADLPIVVAAMDKFAARNSEAAMLRDVYKLAGGDLAMADEAVREQKERKVIAFDGAGGERTGNNAAFNSLARKYGATLYDENAFSGHSNGKAALAEALNFFESNPDGELYLMGYSAGGDEAIWLANQVAKAGFSVSGLVTFDAHRDSFFGIKSYAVPSTVRALNFYQRNAVSFGPNTFRGGSVSGGLNVILPDSNHITIVSQAYAGNRALIDGWMGY
ncbi:hypothetical protein TERTU_0062 [Teredinibacter turnerae T7901]|uniref:Uncharacterized protein n=1 Tax=Teredinibacter turnerae (strain ATCC 39867 / T7901) TaxID=377629 RepID=C5BKS2_TERTT|nr:alpha/beta hydrolase [Teredinibacter turnerae]ACR13174.1 hypothetical protein TERTU_0062 [Teredinibacter turnerae T7901]